MAHFYSEPSHTFSEYLLVPGYTSEQCVPANVSLRTPLVKYRKGEEDCPIMLNIPLVSAIMQAVSDDKLAVALAKEGGMSFIFGSQSIQSQAAMVARVKNHKAGFVVSASNLTPDATLRDVLALKEANGFSTMPVTEEELLIPQLIPVEDARADIGYEVLLDAAETAEDGNITIPLADAGEIRSADLSASALAQVAEKDISLTLEMPVAAVTMDAAALANIAEKAGAVPVTLKINEVGEEDLNESQMAAIEELDQNLAYIFSAELMVTNQSIASEDNGGFGSGKATVRIPMTLAGDEYKVVYLADDGSVEVIENTVYEDGILTMELEHFSTYAILQDSMPGDVNDDGDINVLDLMYLANYFAKGEIINQANADVNADGLLDVRDLMFLANVFAGKETLG